MSSVYVVPVVAAVVVCVVLIGRHGSLVSDKTHRRVEVVGVYVDAAAAIAHIDNDFICATLDWWPPDKCDYDTCSWAATSLLNLDLNNTILINAVKAFSPLKLRLGGTLEDKVIYQITTNDDEGWPCLPFTKNNSQLLGFSNGCLPLSRWDQLNAFFRETGASVVFSLNALAGRTMTRNGLAVGPWDPTNAISLIRYTLDKGYSNIHGWELGNELCGGGIGARVTADQYADDVKTLSKWVDEIYGRAETKPLVIAPGGFFDHVWFSEFVGKAPNNTVQAITHHIYNLGAGIGARVTADQYADDVKTLSKWVDEIYGRAETKPLVIAPGGFFDHVWFSEFVGKAPNNTVQAITHHIYNLGAGVDARVLDRILDPSYLDGVANTFRNLQSILKSSKSPSVAWVGEAGGAYNSGRNHVTNAFAMSFWYLDQLGMSASYDTRTYCRQTLVGGNYGLLDTTTFAPNPDFYGALLWHQLMGKQVLNTTVLGTKKLRVYAHCAKPSQGMVVLLLNLDGEAAAQVSISTQKGPIFSQNKANAEISSRTIKKMNLQMTREEYHLTAPNGDIQSRRVTLNGRVLDVDVAGGIPDLEPSIVYVNDPISVSPFSIVFVHIPRLAFSACR